MYRVYVQPITEKSSSNPKDGELIVNTENGNISVKNNDKTVSSIKEIKSQIEEFIYLLNIIKGYSESISSELDELDSNYTEQVLILKKNIELINYYEELANILKKEIDNLEIISKKQYVKIEGFLIECRKMIRNFFNLDLFYKYKRIIEEISYINNLIKNIDEKYSKDLKVNKEDNPDVSIMSSKTKGGSISFYAKSMEEEQHFTKYYKTLTIDNKDFSGKILNLLSNILTKLNNCPTKNIVDDELESLINNTKNLKRTYSSFIKDDIVFKIINN